MRDAPTGGKIVTFRVNERKRIQIVDYRGIKSLTTTTIEDELKKREAGLKIDTFYDLGKARRVETIIKEMLAEKGRPFATVRHEAKPMGGPGMQVSFVVDEGPKAKVKEIDFVGNEVFSDGKLRGQMKKIKQQRVLEPDLAAGQDDLHPGQVVGARKATRSGSRTST